MEKERIEECIPYRKVEFGTTHHTVHQFSTLQSSVCGATQYSAVLYNTEEYSTAHSDRVASCRAQETV